MPPSPLRPPPPPQVRYAFLAGLALCLLLIPINRAIALRMLAASQDMMRHKVGGKGGVNWAIMLCMLAGSQHMMRHKLLVVVGGLCVLYKRLVGGGGLCV